MIANSVRAILEKLNKYNRGMLEGAVGSCVTRSHYEVTASHILTQALEEGKGDLPYILAYFKVSGGRRVFKMTPIHYTFHHEGWSENRIALSFWGAGLLSALAAAGVARLIS